MRHQDRTIKQAGFTSRWLLVSALAAAVVTTIDAALLQRSRGVFTGGFLSDDHLASAAEIAAFLLTSLLVDLAVAGVLAFVVMSLCAWLGTSRRVGTLAGAMGAVGPLLLVDAVNYEIARYLGPAFDLGLLFDLSGRSVAEFWAVSASQLWPPLLGMTVLSIAIVGGLWLLNRSDAPRAAPPTRRATLVLAALLLVGFAGLTTAVFAAESLAAALPRKPAGQVMLGALTLASDIDGDGFGLVGRLSDPDLLDGAVFPYAVDVPGNGRDENALAGDLPPDAVRYPDEVAASTRFAHTPDVLLVVLESFRADLLHADYGGRPVTPVMNALAARGLAVPRAFSHNGYTVQSRFHLLAGTLLAAEGTRTLLDDFRENGYLTASFSGQDELFGGREYRVGFDRADVWFDARSAPDERYTTFTTPGSLAIPHTVVEQEVKQFLASRAADTRPLFMYVSFGDTHFPYTHRGIETIVSETRLPREQITPGQRDRLWASYVNTAASVDRAIGRVVEQVRATRGSEPAIIVTADHGESLFDDGFLGHGHGLDDVQTRVPFIVANLPMRVPDPMGQIDLREALTQTLERPAGDAMPTLVPARRAVFQYLGDLRRPRQIALLRDGRRFMYDFRSRRVSPGDGVPVPLDRLSGETRAAFTSLIHQWEWMNLSLRTAAREGGE